MTDVLTPAQRRLNMSHIRSTNTKPEMVVRSIAHRLGFRFRLHRHGLPGKPDLVFARHHKIIMVHGCFWHMHCCRYGRVKPATNAGFWQDKRVSNVLRDKKTNRALRRAGWQVLIVWECETRDPVRLRRKLDVFLSGAPAQ